MGKAIIERKFIFFSRKISFCLFFLKKKKKDREIEREKEREREEGKKTSNLPVGTESQRAGLVSSFRAVSFIHA